MARWMLSFGMEAALALFTARRRRGLKLMSAMPDLAATVISFASLENSLALALSALPLRCWMLAHFEWPAMAGPLKKQVKVTGTECGSARDSRGAAFQQAA